MGLFKGLICIILLLLLIVIIFKNIVHKNQVLSTNLLYDGYIRIEIFELKFYWIACILRDVDFGYVGTDLTGNWTDVIKNLLDEIQADQTVKLFSSKLLEVDFLNLSYFTGLDELYDMILAYMFTMIESTSTEISEDIHYIITRHLFDWTYEEKLLRSNEFAASLSLLNQYSWTTFIIATISLVLLVLLLILIDISEIKQRS